MDVTGIYAAKMRVNGRCQSVAAAARAGELAKFDAKFECRRSGANNVNNLHPIQLQILKCAFVYFRKV